MILCSHWSPSCRNKSMFQVGPVEKEQLAADSQEQHKTELETVLPWKHMYASSVSTIANCISIVLNYQLWYWLLKHNHLLCKFMFCKFMWSYTLLPVQPSFNLLHMQGCWSQPTPCIIIQIDDSWSVHLLTGFCTCMLSQCLSWQTSCTHCTQRSHIFDCIYLIF